MKKEVIELESIWYGSGYHFKLVYDKKGFAQTVYTKLEPYNIEDNKIVYFWKKVDNFLGKITDGVSKKDAITGLRTLERRYL